MEKMKLLWISQYVPYDSVPHAGGQIENYYIKRLNKTGDFDITLYTFGTYKEKDKVDLSECGIKSDVYYYTWSGIKGNALKIYNRISKLWIWRKPAGLDCAYFSYNMLGRMHKLAETGYVPDIVVLQWTEISLISEDVKKIFPNAKIVCIEEDVCFLGQERHLENAENMLKRCFFLAKYHAVKKAELKMLNAADLVILNNRKDEKLLYKNGFTGNAWVWCPYFNNMLNLKRKEANKDILFYGAMFREENWKSCLWFIDNVMPLLEDEDVRFVIAGNRPNEQLKKRENDRIKVLGFVESIEPYFEKSLCLAAPLVLGAGVKIKVLEAMSSGIPVLTNSIGIEGINAEKNKDYFYCEKPEEYAERIKQLIYTNNLQTKIEINAKTFIKDNYNYEKDVKQFHDRLLKL